MAAWLSRALDRIHAAAHAGNVHLTLKALRELAALDVDLDEQDLVDILAALTLDDFLARLRSDVTGEWLYAFTPQVAGARMYVKVALRASCIVISFHHQEEEDDEEE